MKKEKARPLVWRLLFSLHLKEMSKLVLWHVCTFLLLCWCKQVLSSEKWPNMLKVRAEKWFTVLWVGRGVQPQSKYCQSALPVGPWELGSSTWLKVMMIPLQVWQAAPQSRSLIRWPRNHRLQPTLFSICQSRQQRSSSEAWTWFCSKRGAGTILLPYIDCRAMQMWDSMEPSVLATIFFSYFCFFSISQGKYLAIIGLSVTNSASIPEVFGPFVRLGQLFFWRQCSGSNFSFFWCSVDQRQKLKSAPTASQVVPAACLACCFHGQRAYVSSASVKFPTGSANGSCLLVFWSIFFVTLNTCLWRCFASWSFHHVTHKASHDSCPGRTPSCCFVERKK